MSDDFSTRYRLLKCILVEDGIRTHNAQELATGKVVMVHISDAAGPEEVEALRLQMAQVEPGHKNKILETATLTSGFAVVTEFLPGSQPFRSWLRQHAAPGAPTTGRAQSEGRLDGGRTIVPAAREGAAAVPELPAAELPAAELPAAELAGAEPGSRLPESKSPNNSFGHEPIQATSQADNAEPNPPVTDSASQPKASKPTASELKAERVASDPAAPSAPPATALPTSPHAKPSPGVLGLGGSFTEIFGAPKDPQNADDQVSYVNSSPPSPPPIKFALGENPAPAPKFAAQMPAPQTPIPQERANTQPEPAWIQPPTPAKPAAAPGEFTMMFAPSADPGASGATPGAPAGAPLVSLPGSPNAASPASPTAAPPASPMDAPPVSPMASPMVAPPLPPMVSPMVVPPASPPASPIAPPDFSSTAAAAAASPLPEPPASGRPPAASLPAAPLPAAPLPAAPPPEPAPPSQFGWDTAPAAAPAAKAPPGEFTMLFGAPATAAPLPDQLRPSPMREAPPPSFSPLTPDSQLESPPVEPMHRVMSSNPAYGTGINQDGPSPIGNSLNAGGYAGRYPASPPPSNSSYPAGQRYSGMPEFAPAPPPPNYPPAHASPLVASERSSGGEPNAQGMPGILPPPIFGTGGSTPLSALGGAQPLVNASAGPSEYTQLIAHGAAPVVPELKPTGSATAAKERGGRRLPTGLIIAINAILLIAALLMFFVLKRQVPTMQTVVPRGPVMPNMPKAPKMDVPPR